MRIAMWHLALAASSCAACSGSGGGGGSGDPQTKPPADPYGTGTRLHVLAERTDPAIHVLGSASWLNPSDPDSYSCAIPLDEKVSLTGLTLTAVDDYDETGTGATGNLYVQDTVNELPAYSGITVFAPGFSPPSLRVAAGDVVDVLGYITEFLGPGIDIRFGQCRTLPEVSGSMEFRFEGSGIPPKVVAATDFADYQTGRQWIGMLVTVENVELIDDPYESNGRYSVRFQTGNAALMGSEVPSVANELFDLKSLTPPLANGQTLSSVTGIVTFFYGFHIAPRSAADIALP